MQSVNIRIRLAGRNAMYVCRDLRDLEDSGASLFAEILGRGALLRVRVTGRSMAPAVLPGDVVTLAPVKPADVRRGDLLLCRGPGGHLVLHRLMWILRRDRGPMLLRTRGDALFAADEPVTPGDILGRVTQVERTDRSGRVVSRDLFTARARRVGYAASLLRQALRRCRSALR